MRRLLCFILAYSSIHAMDMYQKPRPLVELAARALATSILSPGSSMSTDALSLPYSAGIHAGQAMIRQKPELILHHVQSLHLNAEPCQAPATEEFDYVTFSPDGSKLAARARGAGFIGLAVFDDRPTAATEKFRSPISFLDNFRQSIATWSPDGQAIATKSDGQIPCLYDYRHKTFPAHCQQKSICQPCFQPDGKTLLIASDDAIYNWDPLSGTIEEFFTHETYKKLKPRTFADNGRMLLLHDKEYIHILSCADRTIKQSLPADRCPTAITPDGRFILMANYIDSTIQYWDTATGEMLHEWKLHDNTHLSCSKFSSDTTLVAITGDTKTVHLIDLRISACIKHLKHLVREASCVKSCDFHPQQPYLATAGTKCIQLWDLRKLNTLREYLTTKLTAEQVQAFNTIYEMFHS